MKNTQLEPSTTLLAANLQALAAVQPVLHRRLHWPVEGDHLQLSPEEGWTYRHRGTARRIELTDEELQASIPEQLEGGAESLIFGLGLGETLSALLETGGRAPVTVWERDPWVLRLALALHDWTDPISSGRVQFRLGAELLELVDGFRPERTIWHPLLARVYWNERELLIHGLRERRALLCCGELFVDSVADALRAEGFSVYSFDVQRLAVEELTHIVQGIQPQLVMSINHISGLAEFCETHGLDSITWEIDPATEPVAAAQGPVSRAHIFSYREANLAEFRSAGFEGVEYLPLAADPQRRKPMQLSVADRTRFAAPISFVGSSLRENQALCRQAFLEAFEFIRLHPRELAQGVIDSILAAQGQDYDRYSIPELLEDALPGFRQSCLGAGLQDPARLLGELAAAGKRREFVVGLRGHDVHVWGDAGWAEDTELNYRGLALHEAELPRIYNGSSINLDIGRLYQDDIVTMRIFDIMACGGFVLAEHTTALTNAFEVGVEVASYRGLDQLREKVAHYLEHPEEAKGIAERGRQAVLERHTISGRLRTMLNRLELDRLGVMQGAEVTPG